jgi:CSLREA domain-containing protein
LVQDGSNRFGERRLRLRRIETRGRTGLLAIVVLLFLALCGKAAALPRIDLTGPRHVKPGHPLTLTIKIDRAAGAAGFEGAISFDHAAASFASTNLSRSRLAGLPGAFRELGPAEIAQGVWIGSYACPAPGCRPERLRTEPRGAGGKFVLERVRIEPEVVGRLELRLANVSLVAPDGSRIPVSRGERSLVVRVGAGGPLHAAPAGGDAPMRRDARAASLRDLTGDGRLDQQDVTEASLQWIVARNDGAACGGAPDIRGYDVDDDGCLDVADVQAYAAGVARRTAEAARASANNRPLVVNATGDAADATPGNGFCRTGGGVCTLRAAIQEANAEGGANAIRFAIPGGGVHTIQLGSQLPSLNDTTGRTKIDGYTQLGASPNTDNHKSNAQIKIAVRGTGSRGIDALRITSPKNVVSGIAFFNLRRSLWIAGRGAKKNVIRGDFVGTDPGGTFGFTTSDYNLAGIGVELSSGANQNSVGRSSLAGRNVISGNARHGISCYTGSRNKVYNNIIGLSPLGDRRLMNIKHGSDWNGQCSDNIIGGTGKLEGNIFSGNGVPGAGAGSAGVEISHGPGNTRNKIVGNCFGTSVTCKSAPTWARNAFWGIHIEDTASHVLVSHNVVANSAMGAIKLEGANTLYNVFRKNFIGIGRNGQSLPNLLFGIMLADRANRTRVGPGNTIAHNPVGVRVVGSNTDYETITRNSIFANGGLGIDLDPNGVKPNDPGDADSGANQQRNFPVINRATVASVKGSACAGCRVEVFLSDSDRSGYGEGRAFLGASRADSNGDFTVSIRGVSSGRTITATATDSQGNTSEFSRDVVVG